MFIGSACLSETKPECISPQTERQCARVCLILRQKAGFWRDFVQEFPDRQRIPDPNSVVGKAGNKD